MSKKWYPSADQKNGVISRTVDFVTEEVQELIEELDCPTSYGASLLRAIADNIEEGERVSKKESAYVSRHKSTPEHEKDAEEIVLKNEKIARKSIKTEKY